MEGVLGMKKKAIVITAVAVLILGVGGTCAGLTWKNSSQEREQEEQNAEFEKEAEKETTDSKELAEKEEGKTVSSSSEPDVMEVVTEEKEIENPASNEEITENVTDSSTSSTVGNTSNGNSNSSLTSESANSNNSSAPSNNTSSGEIENTTGDTAGNNASSSSGNNVDNSTPVQSTQPTHTHAWVHIDATGHYETVTIQEAWDEAVPIYENVEHSICNVCGVDTTGNEIEHDKKHLLAYEGSGWHSEWRYEQNGTQTVHHDAVTEQRWMEDTPAYDVCSGCGATK